ncbi:MAG: hypothetical protein ACREOH_06420 [Candidatus Entotheonellia bacterium]
MNRRNWKLLLLSGAAIVIIAVVVTVLMTGEEGLRGKIVRLEGNTVTLEGDGGQTETVKLDNVEGLAVGSEVKIEGYDYVTMTGDKASVVRQ